MEGEEAQDVTTKRDRRAEQKRDTSAMLRTGADGSVVNEWLEGRLALRDSDPAKYLRQTSPALRATVARYAELTRGEGTR